MFALADAHGCELIGGDTTKGPLNICITVFGEVPVSNGRSRALLRSGARPGDDLWVSGTLGDARLALEALQGKLALPAQLLQSARIRLERPTPRVALGLALRGIAHAAIDVSDGLLGDLGHILAASGCGATVDTDTALGLLAAGHIGNPPLARDQRLALVLSGGDDYELLFTAPVSARDAVQMASEQAATPVTRIGSVETVPGLRLIDARGQALPNRYASFDHFR
jgi:thiamine-monophosphate kinase